jgi:hypothetical protein
VVIVDTSIWIDFFRGSESIYQQRLENLIREYNKAAICGIILQEVLQGIKDNKSYEITKQRLSKLPFINTNKETYLYASVLYRTLREKGITMPSVDTTIAALAIQNKMPLFTKDKHFKILAKHFELRLY